MGEMRKKKKKERIEILFMVGEIESKRNETEKSVLLKFFKGKQDLEMYYIYIDYWC